MTAERILGAVLAGGRSRRFGSDKAEAMLDGMPLIQHAIKTLAPQVDAIAVVGRSIEGFRCLADRPAPDLGPLGGLAAALHHAASQKYDAVVSVACDTPYLPRDLVGRLAVGHPSHVSGNYLTGYWPANLADTIDAYLACTSDLSCRSWARRVGAMEVATRPIANVNRPEDLRQLKVRKNAA